MNCTQRNRRNFVARSFGTLRWGLPPAALAALFVSLASPVLGATDNWIAGSDNWSVPGNWSAGLPGSGVDVNIVNSDSISRSINYDYVGSPVALAHVTIALTGGTGTATNTLSIPGNNLTADEELVGLSGNGTIAQTAGNNTINTEMDLGVNSGSSGIYNLSGTGALAGAGHLIVGLSGGAGTFNQSGGTVSFTNTTNGITLVLGSATTATSTSGTYNLSGGSLVSNSEYIGFRGIGTFTQTAGTNSVNLPISTGEAFSVGATQGPVGTYTLSGTGILTSPSENIDPTGTFTQNGGTNSITGLSHQFSPFSITRGTGTNGTYNLNGGNLSADLFTENGNFNQTGGTATFSTIFEGAGAKLAITGGTMSLVSNGFSSPQSINSGNLSISGAGVLQMELGGYNQGVNYDWLITNGPVFLGGTLDIDLANGFVPAIGDQFTIMSVNGSGSITGTFDHLTSDILGLAYSVNYGTSNMVQLTITAVPEPVALPTLAAGSLLLFRRRKP